MSTAGDAPPEIEDRLRAICLALPDAYQEQAWVGTRWRVRKRTFAHVVARGAACVVTFRSPPEELEALVASGHPFSRAAWGSDVVDMVLTERTDWAEVAELLTESYCLYAPKKLAALVRR